MSKIKRIIHYKHNCLSLLIPSSITIQHQSSYVTINEIYSNHSTILRFLNPTPTIRAIAAIITMLMISRMGIISAAKSFLLLISFQQDNNIFYYNSITRDSAPPCQLRRGRILMICADSDVSSMMSATPFSSPIFLIDSLMSPCI